MLDVTRQEYLEIRVDQIVDTRLQLGEAWDDADLAMSLLPAHPGSPVVPRVDPGQLLQPCEQVLVV